MTTPVNWTSSPSRDRILKVIRRRELPDCVPVEVGIGPWFAAKQFGVSLIDVVHGNPSAQDLMLECYRRYKYDPWLWATPAVWLDSRWVGDGDEPAVQETVLVETAERHEAAYRVDTPYGALTWRLQTLSDRPTVQEEYPIKDPEADWPKYQHWMGRDREHASAFSVDERVAGLGLSGPGSCLPISWWTSIRDGGITSVTYDLMEKPEFMAGVFAWYTRRCVEELNALVRAGGHPLLDAYFIQGSSSSLSHSSWGFFEAYDLPFLKTITALCKQAGIPSHLHVCGRSRAIVEACHDQTDLTIMEPIECPPGGDCDLGDLKRRFGDRLVLKGNINTFQLMAFGTPDQVAAAARLCLEQAMPGGGFWLATGDQTPADTPEENIFALVETARKYGRYPAGAGSV